MLHIIMNNHECMDIQLYCTLELLGINKFGKPRNQVRNSIQYKDDPLFFQA